ncbi:MarP family serine protease [Agromyces sp. MMS24-K17]|uniref:MarP family serine protease n=1 Tax=Agromyces sp. MMS24-K17 TaxID=3372850 RepID=UPI003754FF61
MGWSIVVDVVLVLVLIGALVNGYRAGLLRTAAGLAGLIAGGIAAWFAMPWVASLVPAPEWRTAAAIATAIVLLVTGASVGAAIGRVLRSGAAAVKLGPVDRVLGAIGNFLVTAFVVVLVGTGVAAMGIPVLSPALAGSRILTGLEQVAPAPARSLMAELRSSVVGGGLPWLVSVLDGPTVAPDAPTGDVTDPEILAATASVVRITGTAFECGSSLAGSGFVVAPDRIVTNAHVVAGVDEPMVEAPGGAVAAGRVVAYDVDQDLALIAVDGFDVAPLGLADPPGVDAEAAIAGYPFGGPFQLRPATVVGTSPLSISTDGVPSTRDVMTLAARVDHGNSGGPVLTGDGLVGGVVFAKSDSVASVGFAIPVTTLAPLAQSATSLSEAVDSGSCAR